MPLDEHELAVIDAYWRAANYLADGQIYLLNNPLLRRPLAPDDIKPRLLGFIRGVRSAICTRLGVLGVPRIDARPVTDSRRHVISDAGATVAGMRIAARGDLVMAEAAAARVET